MKNLKLLSALVVLACTHTMHSSAPAKWQTFRLFSRNPYPTEVEKHSIKFMEGPRWVDGDHTRVFCGAVTAEHPHGLVTKDDTLDSETTSPTIKSPCDPKTCFVLCCCNQSMQPSKELSLQDILRSLKKKDIKNETGCRGLCFFDKSCTCGTAAARYNKSHPHIRIEQTNVDNDTIATDLSVNMDACTVEKKRYPWVNIACDKTLYEWFKIARIVSGGRDVTEELEQKK
ncbi:MAG: hypothetical protein IT346_03130 [Epsilonproteobacteria bacterium]|nr:hypothetical protein [Campylobacterota bacterium]